MKAAILNADDLGLAPAIDEGIFTAHRDGCLTSASLSIVGPSAEEAIATARDHPELGPIWQASGREGPRQRLAKYIENRAREGQLRSDESPRLLARMAIETITTWAIHIKWDRAPEDFEPGSTKEAVIEYVARGLQVQLPRHPLPDQ